MKVTFGVAGHDFSHWSDAAGTITLRLLFSLHDIFDPVELSPLSCGHIFQIHHHSIFSLLAWHLDLVVFDFKVFPLGRVIKVLVPDVRVPLTHYAVVKLVVTQFDVKELGPLLVEFLSLEVDDLLSLEQKVG